MSPNPNNLPSTEQREATIAHHSVMNRQVLSNTYADVVKNFNNLITRLRTRNQYQLTTHKNQIQMLTYSTYHYIQQLSETMQQTWKRPINRAFTYMFTVNPTPKQAKTESRITIYIQFSSIQLKKLFDIDHALFNFNNFNC